MPVHEKNKPPEKKSSIRVHHLYPVPIQALVSSVPFRPLPREVKPMLATLTDKAFNDPDWLFEVKWDGYRAIAILNSSRVSLLSRNQKPFNEKFYPVYQSLVKTNLQTILDGEMVVVNKQGVSRFGALQNWRSEADGQLIYYLFDILWLDGHDLRSLPLRDRKKILHQLKVDSENIRLSEGFEQYGKAVFESARKMGLEGIVAKKLDSTYQENERSKAWLKIKIHNRQEVVIGGYTLKEGSGKLFSSVLVGVFKQDSLVYTGKIGTGFNMETQKDLMKKFKPLVIPAAPFRQNPDIQKVSRFRPRPVNTKVVWLKPKLVCEVSFAEMTSDGLMRHASYQGLRTDKKPQSVVLEKKVPEAKIRHPYKNRIKK